MKKLLALGLIALVVWNAVRTPNGAEYFVADNESKLYSMKVAMAGHLVEATLTLKRKMRRVFSVGGVADKKGDGARVLDFRGSPKG